VILICISLMISKGAEHLFTCFFLLNFLTDNIKIVHISRMHISEFPYMYALCIVQIRLKVSAQTLFIYTENI
jgi:hypothetical protein